MRYIAVLDHDHLDHSFFMKSFSEAMSQQSGCKGILLHSDSSYTESLIQTGMLRRDAIIRSTKDLNRRIVSLLADSNIPATGIHGYQKKIMCYSGNNLLINKQWFQDMPNGIHLVLSNLVRDSDSDEVEPLPLAYLASALRRELEFDAILKFPQVNQENSSPPFDDMSSSSKKTSCGNSKISLVNFYDMPDERKNNPDTVFICSLEGFKKLPDTAGLRKIQNN